MAKSRRKSKRRGSRRRRHRGGYHSLANTAAPYTPAAFAPPGGIYNPGGVNGLDGGYYYGVNVDQSLPDPIATSALFRQRGGRRRRKRRSRRRTRRRRRRGRRTRGGRRRHQKGGFFGKWSHKTFHPPSFKRFLTDVLPKGVTDMVYTGGNTIGNMYRGYVGARPKMAPLPYTNQPINQAANTLGYQPVNANDAYNNAIQTVNAANTPVAQGSY